MPTSGLVIRLITPDPAARSETLRALSSIQGLELGPGEVAGVPAVLEAPDYAHHDAALRAVNEAPFVGSVDVVFHDFSDVEQFERLPKNKLQR